MSTLTGPNAKAVSVQVGASAAELEGLMKQNIASSRPAGRTYSIGSILKRAGGKRSIRNVKGLRRRGDKVVVGSRIHRASAKGQPPAILSGRLVNSIRGRRIGEFTARVGVGVSYAVPLDNPNRLDRPFFISQARNYRPRFVARIRSAWLGS
jgi:hypothetical protein